MEKDENFDTSSVEKIVISGISGRFPKSNNMRDFAENLYNKVDMVDDDESRWPHFHADVPKRTGKINNLEKFDASFFSIHKRLANSTDPQARVLLEHCYEAILDAGISPQSLVGSRTGVFIGCSNSDSKDMFLLKVPTKDGHTITGNANFYIANRISFALGLCGPSFTVDTACSSSAYALDLAYKYIQDGTCDSAIVGGAQLVLNFSSTTEYKRLRVISDDGYCRPFDKNASGFTRADTVAVMFLQKQKDSKRVYANLLHVSTNNDGFKSEGSSFPSRVVQQKLFEECLMKINLDPNLIGYVEAHSTGTNLGDSEEVAAIDGAFCKNRLEPLLIGSLKSNMGHAEASSAVASCAKLILALENQKIAPNINLNELRDDIPALAEGRIKIVTEIQDLNGPFVSLNSFGLGGANAHALFKGNMKSKINNGIPNDNLNRLLCWSGRTEAAINSIFDDILSRPLDTEFIALLQNSQITTTLSNTYRGYGIFSHDSTREKAFSVLRDVQNFNSIKKPVVWIYSGIGSQWLRMGADLMEIPIFSDAIENCHKILSTKGLDLKGIITSSDEATFNNVLHSYVGITAIEIALTDVLKSVGLEPDFIIGHSVGELGCAYCDGCFTAEETILAAYARGESNNESNTILGGMAAIGMNHIDLLAYLPRDLDIACHNAADSTTVSGPIETVKAFIQKLNEKNIFAKEIQCGGVPLHSRYIKEMGSNLMKKLNKIIPNPKKRSEKWLSSTYPSDQWSKQESQLSSAQYHTKNLLNPVLFHEVVEKLPTCVTIEVSPHGLLKPLLKRSMKEGTHLSLAQRDVKDGKLYLMKTLGQIFQNGIDLDIGKLYPPVEFPVSRGTPMISPLIKWNHSEDYFVPLMISHDWFEKRNVLINISDKDFDYIQGHVIDGKVLFPGTGLMFLVWETFSMLHGKHFENFPVILENVKFLRATSLMKNKDVILSISIHKGSGRFEVTEGLSIVCHGQVKGNDEIEMSNVTALESNGSSKLLEGDFYKEMRLRGYFHQYLFRAVVEARDDGLEGKIKWNSNWTTFMDCLLQFQVLVKDTRMLVLPTKFRKMVINPLIHYRMLSESSNGLLNVTTCPYSKIIQAGGVEIHEFEGFSVNRRRPIADPILEAHKFVAHLPTTQHLSNKNSAKFFVQLLLENSAATTRLVSVEIDSADNKEPLSGFIYFGVSELPMVTSDINYLTSKLVELENVNVSQKNLMDFENVKLIIKSQCMYDSDFLKLTKTVLNSDGFIISREPLNTKLPDIVPEGLTLIAAITTQTEVLLLLKFSSNELKKFDTIIRITANVEDWLEPLKFALKTGSVLAYSEKEEISGILGLVNCVRREIKNGANLTCVFVEDFSAPAFDINLPFYKLYLQQGLAMNVFKNNQWGSYRHLQLTTDNAIMPRTEHYYANNLIKGDISSLNWFEGRIKEKNFLNNPHCVRIQYSALNFRDVMQASGKITFDTLSRIEQQCLLGHEFSGVTGEGKRVAGLGTAGAFSTFYDSEDGYMWEIPDNWSLEEAATVPLVYCTVFIAFFHATTIQRGQSILIHAGSGGVGLAALYIAFHHGLEVFTTVSTPEKRNFLLNEFPLLKPENIGNSRDTSFERMINVNTKGRGVDFVLNCLSEDKLLASLRCLTAGGTFLEIGKFDIMNKTQIDLGFLAKSVNIKAVFVEKEGTNSSYGIKCVYDTMKEHMKNGIIKPLTSTVFEACDIQNAFRYLASGKHVGKVLLRLRESENDLESLPLRVMKKFFCDERLSYILVGGMGGFGLELADWLVMRGCKKLVMSSSRGITNGYQAYRIKIWQSYGVEVIVITSNVTEEQGCRELIEEASRLGSVGGIFNLAVALRDGMFENQNAKLFKESFGPKAVATRHLDEISRKLCPDLENFVIFSSVSCGRGNAGQSNYGMANSIMERIIERRHEKQFPGKAIQWGAVGDVGLLADLQEKNTDMQISGTLPQRITSCIEVLDTLLTSDEPIVASMVVAEKQFVEFNRNNVIESLFNILGIRDKKSVSMDSPLSKLGLDSLMTVEITQLLEREFSLFLSLKELQSITLHELEQRTKSKESVAKETLQIPKQSGLEMLLKNMSNELRNDETIVCLKNDAKDKNMRVLIVPGIEGVTAPVWEKLAAKLNHDVYILQLSRATGAETLTDIHDYIIQEVLDLYADSDAFFLVGYSFGTLLTLAIAKTLESRGRIGRVVMVDGSPLFFKRFAESLGDANTSEDFIQNEILTALVRSDFPEKHHFVLDNALEATNWESKLEAFIDFYNSEKTFEKKYSKEWIVALFYRLKMVQSLNEASFPFLESTKISLVVPTDKLISDIPENYNLNRYCSQSVETIVVNGNHLSILHNVELSNFINSL